MGVRGLQRSSVANDILALCCGGIVRKGEIDVCCGGDLNILRARPEASKETD